MKLYMAVTADKYELPCAVADTVKEMAMIFRMSDHRIYDLIKTGDVSMKARVRFVRLEV